MGNTNISLPIAIMAHNEEGFIHRAVESALNQIVPDGYLIKIVVVANGCTDKTEEIVNIFKKKYPDRVALISIGEKGKTKAINRVIEFFDELVKNGSNIPYVVFLDADCEFIGSEVLLKFIKVLEKASYPICTEPFTN
jgi:glycosyltransferase involved in cell wall biosynthesis